MFRPCFIIIFFFFRIVYNLVICHEYIIKEIFHEALKTIGYIEDILLSIGDNDPFLKSIRIALNHITFSMKGHLFKLCSLDTKVRNVYNIFFK